MNGSLDGEDSFHPRGFPLFPPGQAKGWSSIKTHCRKHEQTILFYRNFVNLYGIWLVQGKEEHKLGQTRSQDCCSPIFAPCSCCLRGCPAFFDTIFRYCWLSLELNLVFLSKKKGSSFFSDNISSLVPGLRYLSLIHI